MTILVQKKKKKFYYSQPKKMRVRWQTNDDSSHCEAHKDNLE